MNRRHYSSLTIESFDIEMGSSLLDGSVTEKTVKTSTVTVEDFSYGFEDASHNDVGFDVTFDN